MAIIPQQSLFGWQEIEVLGDLERLRLVLEHLPDEELMVAWEQERGRGRDDYPVRVVWNSILAGIVYQHPSIESLRRELLRNGQLRQLCGFDVLRGVSAVPPAWVYTRCLQGLFARQESIEAMFRNLVAQLRLVSGQENVVYNFKGQVYCHCPRTDRRREMAYGGFEADRETLKYRCPARHYGLECKSMDQCPVKSGVRIPLAEDRRIFTPVARSSYRWPRLYAQRTAVERVNSRLDQSFGFERHFIRGLNKMKLRCTLALAVMLAMALGRIKEKNGEHLRSLVRAA